MSKKSKLIDTAFLDDLASRFIINVPVQERSNLIRICFQIELAHWFYLDFHCANEDDLVPCGIKQFAVHIFQHVPFLRPHVANLEEIMENWKKYKLSVPTYGAILLSEDLNSVLLVQSYWAKSSWGFPKGKVNENEDPAHCAVREVFEETGFDISDLIMPNEYFESIFNYQFTRLYVVCNVPLGTEFAPRTRNEIKCCEWFPIDLLPNSKTDFECKNKLGINANSFFMVMPFIKKLKKWVATRKVKGIQSSSSKSDLKNSKRQRHKSMGDIENLWPPGFNHNQTPNLNEISMFQGSTSKAVTVAKCGGTVNNNSNKFSTPIAQTIDGKRREKPNKTNIKRQLFGPDITTSTPESSPAPLNFSFSNFAVKPQKNLGAKSKNKSAFMELEEFAETRINYEPMEVKRFQEWDDFKFDMTQLAKCFHNVA